MASVWRTWPERILSMNSVKYICVSVRYVRQINVRPCDVDRSNLDASKITSFPLYAGYTRRLNAFNMSNCSSHCDVEALQRNPRHLHRRQKQRDTDVV